MLDSAACLRAVCPDAPSVTLAAFTSILTCLCQGVRMNDSSSGNCVFHRISRAKPELKSALQTRADRGRTRGDVRAALFAIFVAETHHSARFFVAFLKFPPIVQSGSILFRKLDPGRAEPRAWPAPHWLRCSCGGGDVTLLQRKFCNFFIWRPPAQTHTHTHTLQNTAKQRDPAQMRVAVVKMRRRLRRSCRADT